MDTDDVRTWFSGIAGIVGLWLLASPFVLGGSGPLLWSNVGVGVVVVALMAWSFYADSELAFRSDESPTS